MKNFRKSTIRKEHFSTKEIILSSEKIAIDKAEAIELKAILKIVNKEVSKIAGTDLNIRVENSSLIFNVVNQVEIKLNRQVDNKFNGLCFNINALMFEKNSTLVKSEIVAFDMVNRIILADKNIISAYYESVRSHSFNSNEFKAFDNKELYDTSYNETMNTTSFEINTDNKEVLEALKELGVKKARKIKEIKTNDLYIVESLETPEVIEIKKEVTKIETNNNLIPLEKIARWIKRDNDYKHKQEQISKKHQALKPSIASNLYDDDFQEIKPIYITENMTKSNIFKVAHIIAKTFEGDYKACLSMALKEVYAKIKSLKETTLSSAA